MTISKRKRWIRLFGLFVTLPASLLLLGSAFTHDRTRRVDAHDDALKERIGSLTHAAMLYAAAHDGKLPTAEHWVQDLQTETGALPLTLPPTPGGAGRSVAMNRALADASLNTLPHPERAILFFESTSPAPGACDTLQSLVPVGDPGPLLFGFADGHLEDFPASQRAEVLSHSPALNKDK